MTSKGCAVEDHGCACCSFVVERLGHQLRRERQERNGHQQKQVEHHEPLIRVPKTAEDAVVGRPDSSDRNKAGHVCQVRRPLMGDSTP